MKLLVYDEMQNSTAPSQLKSPALSDRWIGSSVTVQFQGSVVIDCVGIGYTDATEFSINGIIVNYDGNGLYDIAEIETETVEISHNGTYVGRIGLGKSRFLGVAPAREPGLWTTAKPRVTASGQRINGAGGVSGRRIDFDVRYKIDYEIFHDIEKAYQSQLSVGFPLFLSFEKESLRFPWPRLYGHTDNSLLFQSSVNKFLYSRRFSFREAF